MSSSGRSRPICGIAGAGLLVAALLIAFGAAGCQPGESTSQSPSSSNGGDGARLLLYCGAGIRPAADEIVKAFEAKHGTTVECTYDGSERLLASIKLSGVGDVYMPGDVHYVEQATDQGLVTSHRNACYFIPVILVQKGNPKSVRALHDLTREGLDVGLGNPEYCAIGRKTLKLFEKNGIAPADVDKNVRFKSVTVNDLGNHIKLGQLDAVIVWDAMAAYFADSGDVVAIPQEKNVISTVAAGILKSSQQPELAEKLVEFIASDEGKAIFRKHNFTTQLPQPPGE